MKFIVNNEIVETNVHPATALLDFLRRVQHLTGTKEGCREGDCGACTVLIGELNGSKINYKNVNSCLIPVADLEGKHIVTIEGLNGSGLSPFQKAMVEEGGTQCGFCTPGFIVSFTGYLISREKPNYEDAIESIGGNICRCTGHSTIKRAVSDVLHFIESNIKAKGESHIQYLTRLNIIPEYLSGISKNLKKLKVTSGQKRISGELVFGGTDIFVQKWEELLKKNISIAQRALNFKGIIVKGKSCTIKASVTVSELEKSVQLNKLIPGFKDYLKLFGSQPIKNRATVGGNVNNASPIGDITNILLALNSKIILKNGKSKREIFLKDYFKGYKILDRKKGELIDEIKFELLKFNSFFNFEKVSKRTYLDIASVNSSIYLGVENQNIKTAHLSAGGVAPIPLYLTKTSEFLRNKKISSENIKESVAIAMSEISPISDARGSDQYKKLLLRQLMYAHFLKLFPEVIKPEELL